MIEAFIDDHREAYGVGPICRVLPIAPSTCYAHKAWAADPMCRPARVQHDAALQEAIERVWEANHGVYGAPQIWHQLRRDGTVAARCTVERLMRTAGLTGVVRGDSTCGSLAANTMNIRTADSCRATISPCSGSPPSEGACSPNTQRFARSSRRSSWRCAHHACPRRWRSPRSSGDHGGANASSGMRVLQRR